MGEQKYSTGVRWILYIISFFSIVVGLIAGIILMTRDDEESKQVGKNCLIAMAAGLVVGCLCYLLMTMGLLAVPTTTMLLLPVI